MNQKASLSNVTKVRSKVSLNADGTGEMKQSLNIHA